MTNLDVARTGLRLNKSANAQQEAVPNGNKEKVAKSKYCDPCDEIFVQTSDLETHLKELQKRYKYTVCSKGFVGLETQEAHENT